MNPTNSPSTEETTISLRFVFADQAAIRVKANDTEHLIPLVRKCISKLGLMQPKATQVFKSQLESALDMFWTNDANHNFGLMLYKKFVLIDPATLKDLSVQSIQLFHLRGRLTIISGVLPVASRSASPSCAQPVEALVGPSCQSSTIVDETSVPFSLVTPEPSSATLPFVAPPLPPDIAPTRDPRRRPAFVSNTPWRRPAVVSVAPSRQEKSVQTEEADVELAADLLAVNAERDELLKRLSEADKAAEGYRDQLRKAFAARASMAVEVQVIRKQVRDAQAKEAVVVKLVAKLLRLLDCQTPTTGSFDARIETIERRVKDLLDDFEEEHDARKDAERRLEDEEERHEQVLRAIERERNEPFLVPALLDVFVSMSEMTERVLK